MSTWADLQAIRKAGLKPSLPVIITTAKQRLPDAPALVIQHQPGEPFHVELLEGLKVWLFVGSCDRASAVIRAIKTKGVNVRELVAYCPCFERMDFQPVKCEVAAQWH